jgi:biopolymer transport protein ExbB/TolQ
MVQMQRVERDSRRFQSVFTSHFGQPFDFSLPSDERQFSPYLFLYRVFKQQALQRLKKNHLYLQMHHQGGGQAAVMLSPIDIQYIETALEAEIGLQRRSLNKEIYLFSLMASLSPFLGLLGTVWGILMTFGAIQGISSGGSQAILGGISMALGTTIVGLIVAIPSLIAHQYFRNRMLNFDEQMHHFACCLVESAEIHYRDVDVRV